MWCSADQDCQHIIVIVDNQTMLTSHSRSLHEFQRKKKKEPYSGIPIKGMYINDVHHCMHHCISFVCFTNQWLLFGSMTARNVFTDGGPKRILSTAKFAVSDKSVIQHIDSVLSQGYWVTLTSLSLFIMMESVHAEFECMILYVCVQCPY